MGVFVENRHASLVRDVRRAVWLLFGAVTVLLLVACTNLTGLTVARTTGRRQELALRAAMGASRADMLRQMAVEALLLATLAVGGGAALAWTIVSLARRQGAALAPRMQDAAIDTTVLVYAAALAALASLVSIVAPALRHAFADPRCGLERVQATTAPAQGRAHQALIVAQVAQSLLLLVGGALLMRSFVGLMRVDVGFRADGVLTGRVAFPRPRYAPARRVAALDRVCSSLRALPGVAFVGTTFSLPFTDSDAIRIFTLEGAPVQPAARRPQAHEVVVSGDYFQAVRQRLIAGRLFGVHDTATSQPVAIVNETMAAKFWPNESALGKRFRPGDDDDGEPWMTVVGVIAAARTKGVDKAAEATFYAPQAQNAWADAMYVTMRTIGDPEPLSGSLRRAVRDEDPGLVVTQVRTLTEVVSASVAQPRLQMATLVAFAVSSGAIALLGLYGALSYRVARRTREIGIRMALGARPVTILGAIVAEGLRLVAIGSAIGVVAAWMASRGLTTMLFGVTPTDPLTYLTVVAGFFAVAAMASSIPAWRAARIDPSRTLRAE